ncbi:MAG: S-layer homology domain-containing protein [Clostridia bacterium]|nr:S-layer homology domain-containing protein [Clostridia bacterium]
MKRWISVLLVMAMLVGMMPAMAADAAVPSLTNFKTVQRYDGSFADVVAGSWYEADVERAFELGLLKGRSATSFAPNGEIQISEALTFACRLHSIYHTGSADFVQGSPWYRVYVDYAVENGIIGANEYGDYTAAATRAQFAQIFAKVLPDAAMPYINNVAYGYIPDLTADMACYEAAYHLYRAGILHGRDATGTFKPETHITRAEIAAIVTRMTDIGARKLIDSDGPFDGFEKYVEALGISTEKSGQKTISGREMTQLLDKLVAYAAPEKLAEWQTKYPVLRASEMALKRIDVLAAVFLAGQHIGGTYAYMMPHVDHNNSEIRELAELEECATWELFGDVPNFQISDYGEDHFGVASHIYNVGRTCTVDGSRIMSYDAENNSFHLQNTASGSDGLLALLRAVSIAETEYDVAADSAAATTPSGVLTKLHMAKANANPVVTSEDHPRWTGFVLGYGYIGEVGTSAREIELSAEWGFNSARVMMNYKTLFSDDTGTADLAKLIELDKLVAAAIENDVHLNICFNTVPGRISYLSEDYVPTGDFDLFINPEKQEQALRIFKTIAARYRDIPNYNLSITPLWEPLNKNLSTGQPAPDYTPEDSAMFLGRAIDTIRAEDPDRLVIYEATANNSYDGIKEESTPAKTVADARGNAIISYNACEGTYVYACMTMTEGKHIDDMNSSMYVPSYPNYIYWLASHLESGEKITLNGLLPEGTEVELYLAASGGGTINLSVDGTSVYSERLPNKRYEVGEYLSSHYEYAESDKCIRVTLAHDTDEIVISTKGGMVDICGIYLTLPEEYAVERWYYVQAYDVHLGNEEESGVVKRKTSGIMICPNSYEGEARTVTIHDDLTYSTESLKAEASTRTVNEWARIINAFDGNCIIRFERGTFSGTTWESLQAYYEDLLESYDQYGYSWWSNDWWEITNKTGTIAEVEYVEYAGYENFNLELLQLLQKYQSKD